MCEKKQKEQAQEEAKNEAFASLPQRQTSKSPFCFTPRFLFSVDSINKSFPWVGFFWEEVWGSRFGMTFGYLEKYRICSQHCQKSIRYTYALW